MLPPATERVWEFLKDRPELAGFVLVGGSALSLRIGHRISEDLDLAWLNHQLPRHRLEALVANARQAGLEFANNDDEATVAEFVHGGLELRDYPQDFLVNGNFKVSFFVPDQAQLRVLRPGLPAGVRVAEVPELFQSKSLLSARRSKSRDWFDLYVLLQSHGFTWRDYIRAFDDAEMSSQADVGFTRLCSGVPQRDDEGLQQLLPKPPALSELKSFFERLREQREVETASAAARSKRSEAASGSESATP
jgi:hypothetical protein